MNKVAIYGGGVVAMCLAIALRLRDYDVSVWRPHFIAHGEKSRRVFALNNQAMQTLKTLGIHDPMGLQPVEEMLIWDKVTGANINFKAADIGRFSLTQIVAEDELWQKLSERLNQLAIPTLDLPLNVLPEFKDNQWSCNGLQADFLCIADGAGSKLRGKLQVELDSYSYHQTAIVTHVKVSGQQKGIAFQVFGPHGPLAFLPTSNQGDYSIVWSLDHAIARQYLQLDEQEFKDKLYDALDGHLGEIINVDSRQSFPLNMLHARQYVSKNWLLAGDCAHHFHPLAGLGLNMGIGDVACLWQLTENNSLINVLGMYQRSRKSTLTPVILGMKFLKNCFENQNQLWVKFRSMGIDFLDNQLLLKKLMIAMVQNI